MKKKLFVFVLTVFWALLILNTSVEAKKLNKRDGVNYYNGTKETYYNLDMTKIYERADKNFGSHHKKWTRSDGVKCYGPYIVLAVPFDVYPYGTTDIPTSLGLGIALDTGAFADTCKNQIDVAVDW